MPIYSKSTERNKLATSCAQLFSVESLAPDLQPRAERLLLRMLDSSALYTMLGGLKPMSGFMGSFIRHRIDVSGFNEFVRIKSSLKIIEKERKILSALFSKGELFATVHGSPGSESLQGNFTYALGMIANSRSMASLIARKQAFFAPYLVTVHSHPLEVLLAVVYDRLPASSRGLGYLMGYPEYAIDFWLDSRAKERATGKKVARDHIVIPTYSKRSNFAWAVPKGHKKNSEDYAIMERAADIFMSYRKRRVQYIGKGKPGPIMLLRDWLQETGMSASAEFSQQSD
jgi:hypothetical protein